MNAVATSVMLQLTCWHIYKVLFFNRRKETFRFHSWYRVYVFARTIDAIKQNLEVTNACSLSISRRFFKHPQASKL